jgi:hypothetical protein
MKKIKCSWCSCEFNSKDNRFEDWNPVCPACDDKNTADMDKAMKEYIEYEIECNRKDQRLLNAIKSIKDISFYESIGKLIDDLDRTANYSLVDSPEGNYQKEYWHKEIQGVWVDQYCNGGYSGDDFKGDVYVKIKRKNRKDKFLKIPYSM